jgi:hypothetical protein
MSLVIHQVGDHHLGEGSPGVPVITRVEDVNAVIEFCLSNRVDRLILYPKNLPDAFFDLSSGEAGAILQKLRNYRIRLAVVRTPALALSSRFGEMLEDERRGPYFRLCDERSSAERWLCDGSV